MRIEWPLTSISGELQRDLSEAIVPTRVTPVRATKARENLRMRGAIGCGIRVSFGVRHMFATLHMGIVEIRVGGATAARGVQRLVSMKRKNIVVAEHGTPWLSALAQTEAVHVVVQTPDETASQFQSRVRKSLRTFASEVGHVIYLASGANSYEKAMMKVARAASRIGAVFHVRPFMIEPVGLDVVAA